MRKPKSDTEYLHDMLAKLDSQMDHMNETLVRHDVNLENHMARTEAAEASIKLLEKHVNMTAGAAAFIGLLALVATIYSAVR